MARIITFSQRYPGYHPKAGQATRFAEKFTNAIYPNPRANFHDVEERIHKLNPHLGHTVGDGFVPHESLRRFLNGFHPYEKGIKGHTIRAGNRWKEGDMFSPRVWGTDVNPKSGRSGPYHSKQIILAPDQRVVRVYPVTLEQSVNHSDNSQWIRVIIGRGPDIEIAEIIHETTIQIPVMVVAKNDGLTDRDFIDWFILSPSFKKTKRFEGQIICWNEINY